VTRRRGSVENPSKPRTGFFGPTNSTSAIEILQQAGATLLGMFIPERKSKLWLAIQWGILVLVAIALWAYARR